MPPFDFPNTPTVGQTVTNGGAVYQWDGVKWVAVGGSGGGSDNFLPLTGGTLAGPLSFQSAGAVGAPWQIEGAAGANPANPWNFSLSQGATNVIWAWSHGIGGVQVPHLEITGPPARVGGSWELDTQAGANPANPWNFNLSQGGTSVIWAWSHGGGGVQMPHVEIRAPGSIGGAWEIGEIAGGNPANPWNFSVTQGTTNVIWAWSHGVGGVQMPYIEVTGGPGAIGGSWGIASSATSNPANSWNLNVSQGGTNVIWAWSRSGGGVEVNDLQVDGHFISAPATNPPNPQNVGAGGQLELDPLALWSVNTGSLVSLGNRSDGIMGTWNARSLLIMGLGSAPYIQLGKANGTSAAPTMPIANDALGSFAWTSYIGNWNCPWVGQIACQANENWTATAHGTRVQIHVTPNGASNSVRTTTFENNGDFTITGATATKPGSTAWVNPSDPRLKGGIEPYEIGLAQVLRLNPIRYRYNGQGPLQGYQGEHVGLDADHVAEVMPSLYGSMEYEGESYGTVDSGELIYTLLNAVKELATEVAELKKRG